MNKDILKILLKVIVYEISFLLILRLLLITIPHEEQDLIYYINLNFHYLIACLTWLNYRRSQINKPIILILGIWYTPYIALILFYILTNTIFSGLLVWINYHITYIYIVVYQLFITLYLFLLSLNPYKSNKTILVWSIITTSIISIINYAPIFISGEFQLTLDPLFKHSYYINLINFALLVIFWHQFTQTKFIFSEYISNILSVYTVLIGLEILHQFSIQNDLIFAEFAQYFNFLLYLILTIIWIQRLNYLIKPESKENENYIKNYYMLQGFIEKPRKGILVTFYSNLNKKVIVAAFFIMISLGIYLFSFGKFQIFIKLNILILILAAIISIILAIVTWHRRWYDAIGFFFKNQNLRKTGL